MNTGLDEIEKTVYGEALSEVRNRIKREKEGITDAVAMKIIEDVVLEKGNEVGLDFRDKSRMAELIFNITRKELDILQPYAEDVGIKEIMVNGPDRVFVEKGGVMEKAEVSFDSRRHLEELVRRIAAGVHREINDLNPIVDARLSDGSRVNAVFGNIAVNGPVLTIRRFPVRTLNMKDLIRFGSITEEAADFLKMMVITGHNIFVSGGTSSGKTTFLNVLSDYIPERERVIVIEDSAELQLERIENLVRLETRNANSQGRGEINMRQLIRTAMRMRPDRIIVGEVRGKEAIDMLQALNSGHDGCMSTGHSGSAEGMIYRLETMVLTAENFPLDAVRKQIVSALDIIVQLGRFGDMSRRVLEISEVSASENAGVRLNRIFEFKEGELKRTGNKLENTAKLSMRWEGDTNGYI